ncbi:hypothetical protein, partial [Romboutsia ilealis]|uniref:hypothetical protein n=1 Tax=Romboutsia ilealis TaxID=1115758 RepID=UPI00272BD9E0
MGMRIVENLLVFGAAFAAEYFLKGEVSAFVYVDFLLLYIVLIAIQRGVGETVLAVLLSTAAHLWMELNEGGTLSNVLTQY